MIFFFVQIDSSQVLHTMCVSKCDTKNIDIYISKSLYIIHLKSFYFEIFSHNTQWFTMKCDSLEIFQSNFFEYSEIKKTIKYFFPLQNLVIFPLSPQFFWLFDQFWPQKISSISANLTLQKSQNGKKDRRYISLCQLKIKENFLLPSLMTFKSSAMPAKQMILTITKCLMSQSWMGREDLKPFYKV